MQAAVTQFIRLGEFLMGMQGVEFLACTMQSLGPRLTSQDLGSSRPCVCAGEGLSLAVVMVQLSGCQLQVSEVR